MRGERIFHNSFVETRQSRAARLAKSMRPVRRRSARGAGHYHEAGGDTAVTPHSCTGWHNSVHAIGPPRMHIPQRVPNASTMRGPRMALPRMVHGTDLQQQGMIVLSINRSDDELFGVHFCYQAITRFELNRDVTPTEVT